MDGAVPYFPIEISRIAASGRYGHYGLCIGTFLLCPIIQGRANGWVAWVGLLILTAIDDKTSWILYMGACYAHWYPLGNKSSRAKLIAFTCIGAVYMLRMIIRVIVVALLEADDTTELTLKWVAQKNMSIMFTGKCRYPEVTLLVFKVSGVLQWVCFWAMIQLII